MKFSGLFIIFSIAFLFSCNKKNVKDSMVSELLIENFDFTKDAIVDTLNVPRHLKKTVKDISSLNVYETEQGGKGLIEVPPNFRNFKELYKAASEQELLKLIDNKNSVVAVYAAVGLLEKNRQNTVPVFQKILTRNGKVHIQDGCILSNDHPAEPLYWKYYYSLKPEELKLDTNLKQLDSMLIFMQDSSDLIFTTVLRNRIYSDHLKKQIAKQAFENHRTPALLYLNSWHKKEYAAFLQKEFIRIMKNDSVDDSSKRKYVSILLSFNNLGNKKAILDYLKKDSLWKTESQIFSQLENNGIYKTDYR